MRRHFETAQFEQAEAARRTIGRVEFVDAELGTMRVARHIDQDVAQRAVDHPRRQVRAVAAAEQIDLPLQLAERHLQLIHLVVARFVDARRLARRPDKEPGKQI